jgi:Kinetochore complex Sim4 subunit Fta1
MDDNLYDTSWTLYFVSNANSSYRDLLVADQPTLDRRAKQFQNFLTVNKSTSDSDSENDRTGGLRECTWKTLRDVSNSRPIEYSAQDSILVSLIYDTATYKFFVRGNAESSPLTLLLAKGPAATVKCFTNFLADAFHANVDPLKLPTSLLQSSLESYLKTLYTPPATSSSPHDANPFPSSQLLKTSIGNLKVTVTFSAPIAPHLKTLDLDIPPETISKFLDTNEDDSNMRLPPKSMLALMAQYMHTTTGLKIPISTAQFETNGITGTEEKEEDAVMRISKITCAAFAISVDGRLKFASKAVESAKQLDDLMRKANGGMLRRIEEEAARRSRDG